jgi:hypothetical protein
MQEEPAISRAQVNVIAIAQGSSELTIAVVVCRDGLEQVGRAVPPARGRAKLAASRGAGRRRGQAAPPAPPSLRNASQ